MIKNVLSIDLDYIMSPSINLYNEMEDLLKPEDQHQENERYWELLDREFDLDSFLYYDSSSLENLKNLLLDKIKNLPVENIYFGQEHDSILTFLCQDILKRDEVFNIYNIDHHHDIFYDNEYKNLIDLFNKPDLGNWVYFLWKNNKLNDYKWIGNRNSKVNEDLEEILNEKSFQHFRDLSFDDLKNINFDYVFICKSERYVPFKFQGIYEDLRKDVINLKSKYYSVDTKSYSEFYSNPLY